MKYSIIFVDGAKNFYDFPAPTEQTYVEADSINEALAIHYKTVPQCCVKSILPVFPNDIFHAPTAEEIDFQHFRTQEFLFVLYLISAFSFFADYIYAGAIVLCVTSVLSFLTWNKYRKQLKDRPKLPDESDAT